MGTVQRFDPQARRKAIWLIAIAFVVGTAVILAFQSYQGDLQSWLERNPDFLLENTVVVFLVALLLISPVLAAGAYLFATGSRTVRAQRFPPPGMALVRDAPVLEGAPGIRRGRVIQVMSLLLLCCAGALPFLLWFIFRSLAAAR